MSGNNKEQPLILVIDDDEHLCELIKIILEDNSYQVITASDGVEGCEQYNKYKPQLVITDIVMPEKEGVEVILTIHQQDADIPIIVISGSATSFTEGYLRMAKKLGANLIINKPFKKDQLLKGVNELLNK